MKGKIVRKLMFTVAVVLTSISCASETTQLQTDMRPRNVESGLVPFTTPMAMFQPDSSVTHDSEGLPERMAHYNVPGVSIAVINDNKVDWAKGYGVIKSGSNTSVTTESLFQAASTSKLVTAVIVLHFIETGALGLDDDVNMYLSSWKVPESDLTRDTGITVRHLLTHQSGLPATNFDHDATMGYPTLVQVLNGEQPALNEAAEVEYLPGTLWQYSNLGCLVIQQLLEDILGKPFPQIAQETIFDPIGMKSSSFAYPLKSELQAREAIPHDAEGIAREPAMHLTALAHGGLMTTPSDLARFAIDLMLAYQGQSGRVLSQQMVRQLFHKELDLDPRMFGVPLGEGLGVFLYGEGRYFLFAHPGSNMPGTNCWLIGSPESGKGTIVMTNGANGELLSMEIVAAVIREYQWRIGQPTAK
jgi:CubicO group peptidase (beta-lactamase class C family)